MTVCAFVSVYMRVCICVLKKCLFWENGDHLSIRFGVGYKLREGQGEIFKDC